MCAAQNQRTTREKLDIFRACFTGLTHVYGTYDLRTGKAFQVKQPVTDQVLLRHLRGIQPYGVYLLVGERTRALAVDFDDLDMNPPMDFLACARNRGLNAYVEISKSKGHHVWLFFEATGVLASKARSVACEILAEIGYPTVEVFPKHDRLDARTQFGNFIMAPLYGCLVPQGKTVFVDEANPARPCTDQWEFLVNVRRVTESQLDELLQPCLGETGRAAPAQADTAAERTFGLPPCAQRMLSSGVGSYQRSACFRLAVQLRKAGLPEDIAMASLRAWALKNRPTNGKGIITETEIGSQVKCAYARHYRGCGCGDPAVRAFCSPACALRADERRASGHPTNDRAGVVPAQAGAQTAECRDAHPCAHSPAGGPPPSSNGAGNGKSNAQQATPTQ